MFTLHDWGFMLNLTVISVVSVTFLSDESHSTIAGTVHITRFCLLIHPFPIPLICRLSWRKNVQETLRLIGSNTTRCFL